MTIQTLLLYLVLVTLAAIFIEYYTRLHKHRKPKRFAWKHYTLFLAYPLAITALILYGLGSRYLLIFAVSAIAGTIGEWMIGYYYRQIVGSKLWEYKRLAINGYTSWLSIPLWGFAGTLFAFIGKLLL